MNSAYCGYVARIAGLNNESHVEMLHIRRSNKKQKKRRGDKVGKKSRFEEGFLLIFNDNHYKYKSRLGLVAFCVCFCTSRDRVLMNRHQIVLTFHPYPNTIAVTCPDCTVWTRWMQKTPQNRISIASPLPLDCFYSTYKQIRTGKNDWILRRIRIGGRKVNPALDRNDKRPSRCGWHK